MTHKSDQQGPILDQDRHLLFGAFIEWSLLMFSDSTCHSAASHPQTANHSGCCKLRGLRSWSWLRCKNWKNVNNGWWMLVVYGGVCGFNMFQPHENPWKICVSWDDHLMGLNIKTYLKPPKTVSISRCFTCVYILYNLHHRNENYILKH